MNDKQNEIIKWSIEISPSNGIHGFAISKLPWRIDVLEPTSYHQSERKYTISVSLLGQFLSWSKSVLQNIVRIDRTLHDTLYELSRRHTVYLQQNLTASGGIPCRRDLRSIPTENIEREGFHNDVSAEHLIMPGSLHFSATQVSPPISIHTLQRGLALAELIPATRPPDKSE